MNTNRLKITTFILLVTASANSCEDIEDECKRTDYETLNVASSVCVQPSGDGYCS